MAVGLTHIVDEATCEDGVRLLSVLLARMPRHQVEQGVVLIGRRPAVLAVPPHVDVQRISRRCNWPIACGLDLQRALGKQRPKIVFPWNPYALAATGFSWRNKLPIAVTVCDPAEAPKFGRWYRSTRSKKRTVKILCLSETIQRRLVEDGVPIGLTTVTRPGVDYEALERAAEIISRQDVGLPPTGRALLLVSPPTREGGQYYALWAAAILHKIWPDLRVLMPGTSKEQRRLSRFIETLYCPEIFLLTQQRFSPAELLAVSDMLVVPAIGDIPTSWLAWAMAASVPIVGSAVPTVTELISDQYNGFLCESAKPHLLAIRIRAAFESSDMLQKCVQTARQQAYDLFRWQPCVDEYLKVIDNLRGSRLAAKGGLNTTMAACEPPARI